MDIKRYRISVGIYDSCLTVKDAADGDWVDYSDVQRLISERDEALEKLAAMESQTPVAWVTDDHLTDKSATTYSKEVAARWVKKGWSVDYLYKKPVLADKPAVAVPDRFNGDDQRLVECATSFLNLDAKGALTPHGLGGHARTIIESFVSRYGSPHSQQSAETDAERFCDSHCTWLNHHPDCPSHESEQSALTRDRLKHNTNFRRGGE